MESPRREMLKLESGFHLHMEGADPMHALVAAMLIRAIKDVLDMGKHAREAGGWLATDGLYFFECLGMDVDQNDLAAFFKRARAGGVELRRGNRKVLGDDLG